MSREKGYSILWSILLSFCIAFGSVSCLITAFALQANTGYLVLYCLGFGLFVSLLSLRRAGNWLAALAVVLTGSFLCLRGTLLPSVEMLIYSISRVYDLGYSWGVVYWSPQPPMGETVTLALCVLITVTVWVSVYTVMRRQPSVSALAMGLTPLFACMVVTDTVPSVGSLFLLLFGIFLLVVTQTVRRRAEAEGNRLTAILLIPALLASLLLFWAVPQENYQPPQAVPGWLQSIFLQFSTDNGGDSGTAAPGDSVNLSSLGPKTDARYVVMEVTAQEGGLLYFRGQSFDEYTGTSWNVSSNGAGPDKYFPTAGLRDAGTVTVYLRAEAGRQFLPYYTDRMSQLQYGRYVNTEGKTYSIQRMVPDARGPMLQQTVVKDDLVTQCLELPEQTRTWAEELLKEMSLGSGQSAEEKAQIIIDFVKASASYDKKTAAMPRGKEDFARWFMEEGETGYCVHFATAATVLLRAAGIPARYVTGYMSEIGGTKTNVMAEDSHAWVEYLDSARGWTVLDPTPAESEPDPIQPTTRPTVPPVTNETTQPVEETTRPTGDTAQTQETTLPDTGSVTGGADGGGKVDLTLLWNGLRILIYVCLAVATLWGQYVLRLRRRRQKRSKGSPNHRALNMWKEVVRFSKLYRLPLSEELFALAEKAKFSQHTLSVQELGQFRAGLQTLSRHLEARPWYLRLLLRLIFAAE